MSVMLKNSKARDWEFSQLFAINNMHTSIIPLYYKLSQKLHYCNKLLLSYVGYCQARACHFGELANVRPVATQITPWFCLFVWSIPTFLWPAMRARWEAALHIIYWNKYITGTAHQGINQLRNFGKFPYLCRHIGT